MEKFSLTVRELVVRCGNISLDDTVLSLHKPTKLLGAAPEIFCGNFFGMPYEFREMSVDNWMSFNGLDDDGHIRYLTINLAKEADND